MDILDNGLEKEQTNKDKDHIDQSRVVVISHIIIDRILDQVRS